MSIPYIYESEINESGILLSESNTHYLCHVLRKNTGDSILITDGKGTLHNAVITFISKKDCNIEIINTEIKQQRNAKLHIAVSFTKNASRMEWFLEKATEIGIEYITPLITHRSEKTFLKKDRFEKILISAMLQSQQSYLPVLNEPAFIEDIVPLSNYNKYIAYCDKHEDKVSLSQKFSKGHDTLFLIGPEGDFTAEEVHLCKQNNFEIVQLGNNRLRTETAALYVCTLFNAMQ